MRSLKFKSSKVIAILMAAALIVGMIPVSALTIFALPNTEYFTVTVTDEATALPIEGATVTVTPVDDSIVIADLESVETDGEGKAIFEAISDYFAVNDEVDEFLATYTVTAENYQDVVIAEENAVTVTADGTLSVAMKDGVKPIISDVTGNPTEWTQDDVTLSVVCNDSDVAEYCMGDGAWQTEATFVVSENGTYVFKAKDEAGNISEAFSVEVTKIDNVIEGIETVTGNPTAWTNQDVVLTVVPKDDDIVEYRVNDGTWQTDAAFTVTENGTYVFQARDRVGNVSDDFTVEVTRIDKEIEGIETVTGNPTEWTNQNVVLTVVPNDDDIVEYRVNDGAWQTGAAFVVVENGTYLFQVKDKSGNISDNFTVEVTRIDKEIEGIETVTGNPTAWTNQDVVLTVAPKDDDIVEYRVNDGTWKTDAAFTVAENGTYVFQVKDKAGNISDTFTVEVDKIDKEIEGIATVTGNSTEWTNQDVVLTVVPNDDDIVEYCVNGAWQTDAAFTVAENGTYAFQVKDKAGNISDTFTVEVDKIDKITPEYIGATFTQTNTGTIAHVLNFLTFGICFNSTVEVTIDATDEGGSAIADYKLIFVAHGEDNDKHTISGESNTFKLDDQAIEEFKGSVYVIITDGASNATGRTQITVKDSNLQDHTTFMIENVAPTIDDELRVNGSALFDTSAYYKTKGDLDIAFTVKDEGSKLAAVEITVNDKAEGNTVTEKGYVLYTEQINANNTQTEEKSISTTLKLEEIPEEHWNKGILNLCITVCDNAGNVATKAVKPIAVDQTAPVIAGFDFDLADTIDVEKEGDLYKAVSAETYGFYFKEAVKVTVQAQDVLADNETRASGVKAVMVYLHDVDADVYYTVVQQGEGYELKVITDLDDVEELAFVGVDEQTAVSFDFTVPANFKGQIYAKAADNVTNEGDYVHPNGSVVESLAKHEATSDITITAPEKVDTQNNAYAFEYEGDCDTLDAVKDYDDSQKVPLYKSKDGILFKVDVQDIYSGIRSVTWTVFEGEDNAVATQKTVTIDNDGNLVGNDDNEWVISDETDTDNLVYHIHGELLITGNHNNMALLVELTDRAGNTSYDYYVFGIDSTNPLINVQYDDKAQNDDEYTSYFRTDREATITITERNFRAEDVVVVITKDGTPVTIVNFTDSKVWKEAVDEADLDNTTYTATVKYAADGDYTFDISYTDNVGNANEAVNYGESIAPTKFTIDKTKPLVSVVYDNNDAQNGNYYKADRIATITITEHNFDAKRVKILEETPVISAWKSEGDVHTATIAYTVDGKYTLDIEFMDMAGNSIDDFAAQEFYIDKTNPVVSIADIVDRSANNGNGNIGFSITATDENFDVFTPVLTGIVMVDGAFKTTTFDLGNTQNIEKGQTYTVTNIGTDGIYSITCTVVDKAGNAYSEVILENANGQTYVEKRAGADKLVTFSVNRNGSTFALNAYTDELVKTYYVKNVTEDVTIIEINADPITENTVTLNGKTLVEDTDYTVTLNNSAGSWYQYSYALNKTLFDGESEYNIVVSSTDKAKNEAFSDIKDVSVKFVVDRTAPVVTVAGLKTNGRYQVETQTVTLAPSDDGGSLKSLIVRTVDDDGKLIEELLNLSGDELADALATGTITFKLASGLYQNVQIVCEDYAGNVIGSEANEIYTNVSVSSSGFMIFWAFKPVRWASIAGVIILTAAVIFFIIKKKRKQAK